ncbi:putative methyltransferase, partial [Trypanosoma grayi]|uniref:putative methyltransferase n=1 Tax=Trypanosoma grayi TaxID=71804 RepID=UPI0004F48423
CADSSSSFFCVFDAASVAVARQIAERCVLLRAVYLLFAAAATVEDLLACLGSAAEGAEGGPWLHGVSHSHHQQQQGKDDGDEEVSVSSGGDCSPRVETVGRHYTVQEKAELAARISCALGLPPPPPPA